jgi:hypothetical protein
MAKLSAAQRKKLPASAFVYPGDRSYPINDEAHARAALRLGARKGTKGSISKIRAKIKKRYPHLMSSAC